MTEALYNATIKHMTATVHALCKLVPPPRKTPFADSYAYRYVEKTCQQAIVQKLARYVSTLRATHLLLEHGLLQEQAALQRVLDEIQEDVTFLAFGIIFEKPTPLHTEFLDYFYQEELDTVTGKPSDQNRPMVSRKKIRAYIARAEGNSNNPSQAAKTSKEISKTYSGFVHAASPQIMDMYFGSPPKFHVEGMRHTFRYQEHREDMWNYFYRGILVFAFAAKALGAEEMFKSILHFAAKFEESESAGQDDGLSKPAPGAGVRNTI